MYSPDISTHLPLLTTGEEKAVKSYVNRNGKSHGPSWAVAVVAIGLGLWPVTGSAGDDEKDVRIEMFAPAQGDRVGSGGRGWFVDLAVDFEATLDRTGFSGFQLTGPGAHNNVSPMPGTFSLGADDRLPGLIVLVSTTGVGAGSCQNIANLFNLTGITNVDDSETELWDTWIVGAPNFGVNTDSTIYVAVASDHNGDGVFNDAPNAVPDANGDGRCNKKDLKAFGIASNIAKAKFFINP